MPNISCEAHNIVLHQQMLKQQEQKQNKAKQQTTTKNKTKHTNIKCLFTLKGISATQPA